MWLWNRAVVWILLAAAPITACIADEFDDSWNWNGFVAQGWSISDDNKHFGHSSSARGSFDFRELGVNGTYNFAPQLRFNGQLLSRWAGASGDGDAQVDYLFADWSMLQQTQQQAGLRIGRLKNPIGFYNDTRDVSFTHPGILLPQSIYLDSVRELELSSDGLGVYYRHQPDYGSWMIDVLLGQPLTGNDTEYAFLGTDWPGNLGDSELAIGRLLYEHGGGEIRTALTYIDANTYFDSSAPLVIGNGKVNFELIGYSLQFNYEKLSLTSEYFIEHIRRSGFGSAVPIQDNSINAYYIQAEYRFDHRWSGLVRFDSMVLDKNDRDGKAYQALTGLPAFERFAEDWTLGLSYLPNNKVRVSAELHHVNGTAWLSRKENNVTAEQRQHWNLLMLQLSYRF